MTGYASRLLDWLKKNGKLDPEVVESFYESKAWKNINEGANE